MLLMDLLLKSITCFRYLKNANHVENEFSLKS